MPRLVTGLALLSILVCAFPFSASAAALVDINTADATALETLPGIGPSKASAIIEYRTQHGPFVAIADIQEVSGIGPATYANIQALITVGSTGSTSAAASTGSSAQGASTSDSNATASTAQTTGTLSVQIGHVRTVTLGTPVQFSATVSLAGHNDSGAIVSWSFGDGSSATGHTVTKSYRYVGTYAIHVIATEGSVVGEADTTVTVVPAQLRIIAVGGEGITLANDASSSVDIGTWRLTAGTAFFYLPAGMTLLPSASVLLPQAVTSLPVAYDARLYTADGQLAAAYELPASVPAPHSFSEVVQPSPVATSSYQVQNVESAGVISVSKVAHGTQAVSAPAAPTEVAAAGAAQPIEPAPTPPLRTRLTKTLESPWALGVLGLLVFSGGALIVL